MANGFDPRVSSATTPRFAAATGVRTGAYDEGLRSYMLSVYNRMTSGVLLTGIVAMLFAWGGMTSPAARVLLGGGPLAYIIMFAPLGFVFAMSFGQARMKTSTLQAMFWGFAVVMATGYDNGELRERFRQDGRVGFLAKPYCEADLSRALSGLGVTAQPG